VSARAAAPVVNYYGNPFEAAKAHALALGVTQTDLRLTRSVSIFDDDRTIDLRVELVGANFCRWYGVSGVVRDGRLAWSADGSSEGTECATG